ncbi:radical SAM protein [Acidilobus sp. SCGC AC-742_E15]|nr:radical SAM protein [Acidilobus sp. SCGC AC-742_E15]
MRYEEPVFRPPSEAYSLIIQATIGCSHNKCTFCGMYRGKRFRIRDLEEIKEDILLSKDYYGEVKRIFLADGNALAMPTNSLLEILDFAFEVYPELERVTAYASPNDLLEKTDEEIRELAERGLKMVYLGVETGDDELLREIRKGATAEEMIAAGRKAIDNGMLLSVTILIGIGGKERSYRHAKETAKVINAMEPHYTAALTLMLVPRTPLYRQYEKDLFHPLDKIETLQELRWLIEDIDCRTVFRSNHASNYLPIRGNLPEDKDDILKLIDYSIKNPRILRPEFMRGL